MQTEGDEMAWAQEEFGRAQLGNRQRLKRLVQMGARVAQAPDGVVTSVFSVAAEREGAFRFLESDLISTEAMMLASHLASARRCQGVPFVYVPVDQTSLNLTDRAGRKGFGAVGRSCDRAQGLQVMSSLLVTPDGTPQGLGGQVYWARVRGKRKKRPQQRDAQPACVKETERWRQTMRQSLEALAQQAPGTKAWFQLDRGGDAWPILDEFADHPNAELTIRAAWNRKLVGQPGEAEPRLWATLEAQEPLGSFMLEVSGANRRTARAAHIQVRASHVTLHLRDKRTGQRFPLSITAVLAREEGTVPTHDTGIQWMLLTTHRVRSLSDAHEVVLGYAQRWRIENFHQSWKSGTCCVESTQLRSLQTVQRWAILLAAAAMRIQRLMHLSRGQPDEPATVEFTQPEIDAVITARRPKGVRPGQVPRIADLVRWIADEGGYTGKSSGGPPGAKVLSRGLERLQILFRVFTQRAAADPSKKSDQW